MSSLSPLDAAFAWGALITLALALPAYGMLRLPHRPRGSLDAPAAGEPDREWERFARTGRTLDQMTSGLPVGLVLLTPLLGARSALGTPWALAIVAVAVAVPALWINPGLRRELGFARALLAARGAPEEELDEEGFVELWEAEPVDPEREPWEGIGFVVFGDDALTLYAPGERIEVPRAAVLEVATRPRGVHPLGVAWSVAPEGEDAAEARREIFFLSRVGETRLANARAHAGLAARLARWHEGG